MVQTDMHSHILFVYCDLDQAVAENIKKLEQQLDAREKEIADLKAQLAAPVRSSETINH